MYNLQKKCRQFSESAIEASKKIEEISPEVSELAEETDTEKVENFSVMSAKTKVRRIKKLFSEAMNSIDDSTVNAQEVLNEAEKTDDDALINRAKVNVKAFSELQKEFKKLNDEAEKVAEISASKGGTNIPTGIAPADKDLDDVESVRPKRMETLAPANNGDETLRDASKLDVKTSINFSSLYINKCNGLIRQFNKVMECFSSAVDTAEILGDYFKNDKYKNVNSEEELDSKRELKSKLDEVPEEVSATAIELSNFTQNMAEKLMDIAEDGDINKEKFRTVQESFARMAKCFDDVTKEKTDENINATIEAVEDCKQKIEDFAKTCKFSVRRKLNEVTKTFSEIDGIMDNACGNNVTMDEVMEFFSEKLENGELSNYQAKKYSMMFSELADRCDDAVEDAEDEETENADFCGMDFSEDEEDDLDDVDFSEEDLEDEDLDDVNFGDEDECDDEECDRMDAEEADFCDMAFTDDEEAEDIKDKNEQINDAVNDLEVVEDKVDDEAIRNFSFITREAIKNMICFSEEDVDLKLQFAEALTETLQKEVEKKEHPAECECEECKAKEEKAKAEAEKAQADAMQQQQDATANEQAQAEGGQEGEAKEFSEDGDEPSEKVAEADERINDSLDDLKHLEDKIEDEKVKNFSRRMREALRNTVCFSEEDVDSKLKDTEALTKDVSDELAKQKEAKDEKEGKEVHIRMDDKKSDAAPAEECKDTKTAETKVTFRDEPKVKGEEAEAPKAKSETEKKVDKVISNFSTVNAPEGSYGSYIMGIMGSY